MENNAKKTTREAVMYLIFGVLTTAVSWIVRFGILWPGKAILGIVTKDFGFFIFKVLYSVILITIRIINFSSAELEEYVSYG